jgi:hypothetical protein
MGKLRHWALAALVVTAAAPVYGYAASLGSASKGLGANTAPVSRCDTDGMTVLQNLSGANVVSVTVGSIASACAMGTLSVNLNNGTTNQSGTGTVPAGGGSLTVTLASAIAAKDAETIQAVISGP